MEETTYADCEKCKGICLWDGYYDAIYCPNCNEWKNKPCGHSYPDCWSHCDTRPAHPLNLIYDKPK